MKLTKILLSAGMLIALTLNISKAGTTNNLSKESDLVYQMKQEIKSMLMLPVYLKFEDNNLKGEAIVFVTVQNNGKLSLVKVEGENKQLNGLVASKVNSINAWAGKEFAGKTFSYTIKMN